MKRILTICVALFVLCGVGTVLAQDAPFSCSGWAAENIAEANARGIIPAEQYFGNFSSPISRNDIAELLLGAYEKATHTRYEVEERTFTDTHSDAPEALRELGIMSGMGEGVFAPYGVTTREQMAKIILAFAAAVHEATLVLPTEYENSFVDFDVVSDWAKPYVERASLEGLMQGYEDGRFAPWDTVSWEQAIALVLRCVDLAQKPAPRIVSPAWDDVISSGKSLSVSVQSESDCTVYVRRVGEQGATRLNGAGKNTFSLSSGKLLKNSFYYIYAVSDGVISNPVRVYTDQYGLFLLDGADLKSGAQYLRWNGLPDVDEWQITLTEQRLSRHEGDIPPNQPQTYEVEDENSLWVTLNPNKKYTITLMGGEYTLTQEVFTRAVAQPDAERIANTYPTTKEEADALVTEVTVPVWRLKNGRKVSGKATLYVHNAIADKVKLVFEEIYNGAERFPIKDVGAYSWRGGTTEHNGGTAIDINAEENYCVYSNGTTVGTHWKPHEDPYSITPYGDVIRAFEKYGFTWGGDAWSNPRDYMHFSYLGT